MSKIRPMFRRYDDLIRNLSELLIEYKIDVADCDVFENVLLFNAGVHEQNLTCFFNVEESQENIVFKIQGLNQNAAEFFFKYLASFDSQAKYEKVNNNDWIFKISAKTVLKRIFPEFKTGFAALIKEQPSILTNYQNQCEENYVVRLYSLMEQCKTQITQISDRFVFDRLHDSLNILHGALNNFIKRRTVVDDKNKYFKVGIDCARNELIKDFRYCQQKDLNESVKTLSKNFKSLCSFFKPQPNPFSKGERSPQLLTGFEFYWVDFLNLADELLAYHYP